MYNTCVCVCMKCIFCFTYVITFVNRSVYLCTCSMPNIAVIVSTSLVYIWSVQVRYGSPTYLKGQ